MSNEQQIDIEQVVRDYGKSVYNHANPCHCE